MMTLTTDQSRFPISRKVCVLLITASLCIGSSAFAVEGTAEWRQTGGDNTHQKYSSLNQINRETVKDLKIVWQWASADSEIAKTNPTLRRSQNQTQPIMVGDTLYTTTATSQLAALDPRNGQERWIFNPKSYDDGPPTTARGFLHRGQSYWSSGAEQRILFVSSAGDLLSVDADTGKLDPGFGDHGRVELKRLLTRKKSARTISGTSPPIVIGDVVIPSYWMSDQSAYKEMPPGDVWGFNVRTGQLLWTFHTIPRDGEFGAETWEGESRDYTGNANPWAPIAGDNELGYVYVPVSMPTNLWYGGHRRGDNLFANCIVCLDAKTGKRIWHYQLIHHDIWDYDVAAAPVLCDITVEGRRIKAVAQVTKQAFCYVLDRVTGEPVWPITERAVPASDTPGESVSPTQPIPTKPAPFDRQGFGPMDVINLTPELYSEARQIIKQRNIRFVPLYQPATEHGVMQMPGFAGGANWGGAAFDRETGRLYVPSISEPISIAISRPDPNRSSSDFVMRSELNLKGPQGLPLLNPPYSRVTAIDLNTGNHVWMTPNGAGPRDHPALKNLNLGPLGSRMRTGILVTKELVFTVGRGYVLRDGDTQQPMLYAYDKTNGALLAEIELPHRGLPGPMTYMIDGRQFIALGTGYLREPQHVVALALDR